MEPKEYSFLSSRRRFTLRDEAAGQWVREIEWPGKAITAWTTNENEAALFDWAVVDSVEKAAAIPLVQERVI